MDDSEIPDQVTPETEAETSPAVESPALERGIPWRLTLFLLLAVLVVVFSVQNTHDTVLRFINWDWEMPLVVIILGVVVVTIVLDQILGGIIKRRRFRRRQEHAELRRLRGG